MPTLDNEKKLDEKIEKRLKNWITIAEEKHKNTVKKEADKFAKRLRQDFPALTEDKDQVFFNYYKSNLSRMLPVLVPKEIHVNIKPENDENEIIVEGQAFDNRRAAIILSNKISQIINDNAFKYTMRAATYDLLLANLGTIVVGQETEVEEEEVIPEGTKNILEEKAANGELIPGETPVREKQVKAISKPPRLVIKRESWRNIRVDPKATDYFFANKRYAVRVVRLPYEGLKDKYGKDISFEVDDDLTEQQKNLDEAKTVPIYEVYDYTNGIKRYSFIGKGSRFLDEVELNYDPLAIAKLNYLPDEVYPPSDMTYYENQVDEANFYRTAALNSISRALARKILYDGKSVTDDAIDLMMSSTDMEPVKIDAKDKSIGDKMQVWQATPLTMDVPAAQRRVEEDIREISNVNAIRLGQVSSAPATNATLANNAFESQVSERSDIIRDWIVQIIERVIVVLKEISIEKEDLLIKRPDGTTEKITWSQVDIANAKVNVKIDITADLPSDVKMRRLLDYIGFITQPQISAQLANDGKRIQMFELVKEVSGYFLPDKNFDRFIVDDAGIVDPDRENLVMLAGSPMPPQPQEDFKKHLEAHQAFLNHPAVQMAPAQVKMLVEEHVAATNALVQQQEALKKPAAPAPAMAGQIAGGAVNVAA